MDRRRCEGGRSRSGDWTEEAPRRRRQQYDGAGTTVTVIADAMPSIAIREHKRN